MRARHAFYGGVKEQTSEKDAHRILTKRERGGWRYGEPSQPEPRQRGCRRTDIFCRSLVDFAVLDVTFITCTV